jgi:hypothetical protein
LSSTDGNSFDLASVGRDLNFWGNLADKIHNFRPKEEAIVKISNEFEFSPTQLLS